MTPALTTDLAADCLASAGRNPPAALVLLAGGLKPSPLREVTGRDPLDLPVAPGRTLMEEWRHHAAQLGLSADAVRVALDASHPAPNHRECRLVRDASEYRGAGGALRDAVTDLPDDAYVLAAPASQLLLGPLSDLTSELASTGADASLLCNVDGTPGMLLLARVGLLRHIPSVGFVDLKEQALPQLAGRGHVRAVRCRTPRVVCVRTPAEFLRALRLASGGRGARGSVFSFAESGADVGLGVTLHDSVVLSSACVGGGAVVVRSLIGPGAVVRPGEVVVDRVVTAPRKELRR